MQLLLSKDSSLVLEEEEVGRDLEDDERRAHLYQFQKGKLIINNMHGPLL